MDPAATKAMLDGTMPAGVPAAADTLAVVALIAGLVLWLVGGKVLRPLLAIAGFAGGAVGGAVLATRVWGGEAFGVSAGYIGLGVGAAVGGLLAFALFRFAMAAGSAMVFAAAGVLGVGVYLSVSPGAGTIDLANARSAARDYVAARVADDLVSRTSAGLGLSAAQARAGSPAEQAAAETGTVWTRLPESSRLMLIVGGVGGALVGLALGALAPRRAAAIVTAWLGAVVWLASLVWLASDLGLPGRQFLDQGPAQWLVIWLVVALIGLAIQVSGKPAVARPA